MLSTDGTLPRDIVVFFGLVWLLGALLAHFQHLFYIKNIWLIVVDHVVFRGKVLLVARLTIEVTSCNRQVSPFK